MLTNFEIEKVLADPDQITHLYDKYKTSFVSDLGLSSYINDELAIQAIWVTYVSHRLKDYGNGPLTLDFRTLLSADTIMCSQYATIALNLLQKFTNNDSVLKSIGWNLSYIGNHAQLLFESAYNKFLLDPTTGMLVKDVTLEGIASGMQYNESIIFAKNDKLDWYINNIKFFYSQPLSTLADLDYYSDGYNQWTYNLRDIFGFEGVLNGINYKIADNASNNLNATETNINIFARGGNDVVRDNGFKAFLYGGKGNDTYYIENYNTRISEFHDANSKLDDGGIDKVFSYVSIRLPDNIESCTLLGLRNTSLIANKSNNALFGNKGDNKIFAGLGADRISGLEGADEIYLGNDISKDIVYYRSFLDSTTNRFDRIFQFSSGIDKVDLSLINTLLVSEQKPSFQLIEERGPYKLWLSNSITSTFLNADLNGDSNPDMKIELVGVHNFNNSDLVFGNI